MDGLWICDVRLQLTTSGTMKSWSVVLQYCAICLARKDIRAHQSACVFYQAYGLVCELRIGHY